MALFSSSRLRTAALLGSALLLAACSGPQSPQEVTKAFWGSVIDNDKQNAVEYSTLSDVAQYDGFSRDWHGLQPQWGRVVIDGDRASIATRFDDPKDTGAAQPREFATVLVRRDEHWKVDYARTSENIRGPLADLFGRLNRLGEDLSRRLEAASNDTAAEMDRLSDRIERFSASASEQAADRLEQFGRALRQSLRDLAEFAQRALDERGDKLPEPDRRTLRGVVADLNSDSDRLSHPTLQSVAQSGRSAADAQRRLDALDADSVRAYKEQWREQGDRIEQELKKMVEALSAESA